MTLTGTNTYLLGESEPVVIDPGPSIESHVKAILKSAPGKIALILLTHSHPDHAGGARLLQKLCGAPVAAHARSHAGPDVTLADGDWVRSGGIELRALHTPGHASDHLCFHAEAERAIFTGDLVLGEGSTTINPPDGNLREYMESLRRIEKLSIESLLPGHGPTPRTKARIAEMIRHRVERHRAIAKCVKENVRDPVEIVKIVYPELQPGLLGPAIGNVEAHLDVIQKGLLDLS